MTRLRDKAPAFGPANILRSELYRDPAKIETILRVFALSANPH